MKSDGNQKRKLNQSDDDIVPGTPQEKQLKKKTRRKTAKTFDCSDLFAGIDFTEDLVPAINDPATGETQNRKDNFDDLLNGIDFHDDFNNDSVPVSLIPS